MGRKPKIGINMKIYQTHPEQADAYARSLVELLGEEKKVDIFYLPTAVMLNSVAEILKKSPILYGAQNMAPESNGAYTGEISIESLKSINSSLVAIGHFERRTIFHESQDMIARKVSLALEEGISPILCTGEEKIITESSLRKREFQKDLEVCLKYINPDHISKLILAYEPFWAIGKTEAADQSYVHESHRLIREIIKEKFGKTNAENVHIIYGGSVSKEVAYDLAVHKDVDGLFVGRFGHDPKNFQLIVEEVKKAKKL